MESDSDGEGQVGGMGAVVPNLCDDALPLAMTIVRHSQNIAAYRRISQRTARIEARVVAHNAIDININSRARCMP